ncbi:MAG: YqgE/AlgH family protein [Deltaproteobacteria bacterium]|nr:YqgE/AlgH family protein [Deltaproteobacteria bacterium]
MVSELAPGFLVASPSLTDPNFKRSVVLLIDHRPEGSLGFVVNRPAQNVTFRGVVDELGLTPEGYPPPNLPVMVGGPVQPHTGWIVFDPSTAAGTDTDSIKVNDKLRVSASRDFLRDVARERSVSRHLLILGYAGWGAGQLDQEIRQGAWIPVDVTESILFETPWDDRWKGALAALGIEPAHLVGQISQA